MSEVFDQEDYNTAVKALDTAFAVFDRHTIDHDAAKAAFENFVCDHYLPVWRQICSKNKTER